MKWLRRLFSFRGRAGRLEFWLLGIPITAAIWGVLFAFSTLEDSLVVQAAVLFGLLPVGLAANLALGTRRLHDRGRSGLWLLLYHGGPVASMVWLGIAVDGGGSPSAWFAVPLMIPPAAGLIDLGLLGAKASPNRYVVDGPDASVFD